MTSRVVQVMNGTMENMERDEASYNEALTDKKVFNLLSLLFGMLLLLQTPR